MDSDEVSYDGDITIFSPQGRLYQVEYARETVKKGATTLGLKYNEGVILITLKNISSQLIEINALDKINEINNYTICTFCGLSADARQLIDFARDEVQIYNIWYNEQISIKTLVENICEYMNVYSRFEIVRPFGVVLLIAGIDEKGPRLFATDPSGSFLEYKAICEGKKNETVTKYLEKYFKSEMDFDNAINLGINAIKKSTNKKINSDNIEIAFVGKNKPFQKFSIKEINKHIKKIKT